MQGKEIWFKYAAAEEKGAPRKQKKARRRLKMRKYLMCNIIKALPP